ncbi:MAG: RNA methyltransferase [Fibrobacterota bacterium]
MLAEKILTSLSHKKYRDKHGLFLIEGPDVIQHCLEHQYPLREVLVDEANKGRYQHEIVQAKKRGVPVYVLPVTNIGNLAETETTQGILAVGQVRRAPTDDPGLSVYLDRVQDPGNVGAVIRSAAAAGFNSVIAGRGTVDFYNPKVVRGSAGGFANVRLSEDPDGTLLSELRKKGYTLTVTDVKRGRDYRQMERTQNRVIVMGNEGEGVAQEIASLATERVHIPMPGAIESLNIAVAFGILAFSLAVPPKG